MTNRGLLAIGILFLVVGIGLFLGPGNGGVAFIVISDSLPGIVAGAAAMMLDSWGDHAWRVNVRRTRSACRGVSLHFGR